MSRQSSLTVVAMMYCTGTCTFHDSNYGDMADVKRYRPFTIIERQCHGEQLVFHISRSIALRGVAEAFPLVANMSRVHFQACAVIIHAGLDSLDPQMCDNARGDIVKPSYGKQPAGAAHAFP